MDVFALAGSALGMMVFVRVFLILGGVWFTTARQIVAAYVAAAIASIFVHAAGAANGGPPDFSGATLQIVGSIMGGGIDLALLWFKRQG